MQEICTLGAMWRETNLRLGYEALPEDTGSNSGFGLWNRLGLWNAAPVLDPTDLKAVRIPFMYVKGAEVRFRRDTLFFEKDFGGDGDWVTSLRRTTPRAAA